MTAFSVGSIGWFARHEFDLTWRDLKRMMTAGRRGQEKYVIGTIVLAAVILHLIAYLILEPILSAGIEIDKPLLLTVSGSILLTLSLMMSQAMEMVTRVFYSRSDLDLVLSSPVSAQKIFTVRIGAIATTSAMLSLLLFGPAINVLALVGGLHWLAAYGVILACGAFATAVSLALTVLMFQTLGAAKTRLVSQIVAAVVGAGFIIGIQLAAIASMGTISRFELFQSEWLVSITPVIDSPVWIAANAVMGDLTALLLVSGFSFGLLGLMIQMFAGRFGEFVIKASGVSLGQRHRSTAQVKFKPKSVRAALRHKEWKLLLRDHWLLSQTLMQILYLIPPAFMLWQGFGSGNAIGIVGIPVLVMATGQLAGGLAWLAISGEDAPQLVQTAPIADGAIIRAKVEAVLGAILILVSPIMIMLAFYDPYLVLLACGGVAAASISATMIQLWFRSQASRSSFRRRQTSSKVATLAEAFSSIMWAATTALFAASYFWPAWITVALALIVLWIARAFRPSNSV